MVKIEVTVKKTNSKFKFKRSRKCIKKVRVKIFKLKVNKIKKVSMHDYSKFKPKVEFVTKFKIKEIMKVSVGPKQGSVNVKIQII